MNKLLIMKKSLAMSMTILLTLAILLSTVGAAMAQENRAAPVRNVPLRHRKHSARPILLNWKPFWMICSRRR